MEWKHGARNDTEITNTQHLRGPAATWDGRSSGLNAYIQQLHPPTQTLDFIFGAVRHDSWGMYVKVGDLMPAEHLEDCYHEGQGIWSSRSVVVGSIMNGHRCILWVVCVGPTR